MKKYLLFAGDNYYPMGSIRDLIGDFDTVDEALAEANRKRTYDDGSGSWSYAGESQWYDVVEHATMKSVAKSNNEED